MWWLATSDRFIVMPLGKMVADDARNRPDSSCGAMLTVNSDLPVNIPDVRISYDSANTTPKPGTYSELQMPLLWVCHNFRAFVFKRFCYNYRLFLSDYPDQSVAVFESWPQCLKMDDHAANHSEVSDVYSGKVLRRLSASPYTGCGFLLVRKLTYYLNVGNTRMAKDSSEAKDNITAFVQRIKEVAPVVSEVSMEIFDPANGLAHNRDMLSTDLAKGLFWIVETTVITHCSESLVEYMDLNLVCNLVRLVCDIKDDSSPVIPLIRRNAPTLQSLVIAWDDTVDLAGLIRNPDDGAYLEYPCLHTLKLHSYYEADASQRPTLEGAAPFPYLRYLRIDGVSPFGDDVLFRGNSTVLEYLRLELNLDTVTTLKQYSVFTPTSHPKLQRVMLDRPSDDLPAAFIDANAYM
ncbi:hypothetical protein H4R27_004234 [Coemansia aciculifera]|nr:hypothetical protein H4R27_004234 [Coemansia aciculifera]